MDDTLYDSLHNDSHCPPLKAIQTGPNHSHRSNIFADSPYYDATANKEVFNLDILGKVFKDILSQVSIFTDAEKKSALAARNLSIVCKLKNIDARDTARNEEGVKNKEKAVGFRISRTLESFATVLEDMAVAKESMCKIIGNVLNEELIQEMENDLQSSRHLQEVAKDETRDAEILYYKYLNEMRTEIKIKIEPSNVHPNGIIKSSKVDIDDFAKDNDGANHQMNQRSWNGFADKFMGFRSKIEDTQPKKKSRNITVINWLSARRALDGEEINSEDSNSSDDETNKISDCMERDLTAGTWTETDFTDDEDGVHNFDDVCYEFIDKKKATNSNQSAQTKRYFMTTGEIVNVKKNLHIIRQKQTSAELQRFQVLKHLADKKYTREFKFTLRMGQVARQMENDFCNATNVVKKMISLMNENESICAESYADYHIDTFGWEKMEKSLLRAINDSNDDISKMNKSLSKIEKNKQSNFDNIFSIEMIENEHIWNLPNMLAEHTINHKRKPSIHMSIEGWMYEKMESVISELWFKRWYILTNGALYYLESCDGSSFGHSVYKVKVCDIVLSSIKETPDDPFSFQLIINNQKSLFFKTRGPHDFKMWINGIRSTIGEEIANGNMESKELNQNIGKRHRKISTEITETMLSSDDIIYNKGFDEANHKETSDSSSHDENISIDVDSKPPVRKIMESNLCCADCNRPSPDWVSLNLGAVLCIECSGVHRSLGVHVSKVRSLLLDSLTKNEIRLIDGLGNDRVNAIWEKNASKKVLSEKPTRYSDRSFRANWIRKKYVEKRFVDMKSVSEGDNNVTDHTSRLLYNAARIGDLAGVAVALAQGGDINWKNDQENNTTVFEACLLAARCRNRQGDLQKCIELLVQNNTGASIMDRKQQMMLEHIRFSSSKFNLRHS